MKEFLEFLREYFLGIILLLVFVGIISLFSFGSYSFFAPKYTHVQYEVFKNSQQYNDGMAVDLEHYYQSYIEATTQAQKDAIRSIVAHQFAAYSSANLPPELQDFLRQMKGF